MDLINDKVEIGVRIHNSSISISAVERIIEQRDKSQEQLQKASEALCIYLKELQKLNKYFNNEESNSINDIKYKKLLDNNNNLKELLKVQLERTEDLRKETKVIIDTLKQELNTLIKAWYEVIIRKQ